MSKEHTPALILGPGLTALGTMRSLARKGIVCYSLCHDTEFLTSSRWYRPLAHNCGTIPKCSQLGEFLESLPIENAVLMPCSDEWAVAVAGLPAANRRRFPASSPSVDVVETFTDKWRFAQLLQSEALPHPPTELIESMRDLEDRHENCFQRRFLKPIASLEFGRRHKKKAFLIKNKDEALALMRVGEVEGRSDFPIMLQEYIPGSPANHYFVDGFVDHGGVIRALFARQRQRMFPPLLGNSTSMETVPVSRVEGAVQTIKAMFSALPYRGIFSAEFKYDERDGLFKILEVNARPWWFIEFACRCGVDVCEMSYRDALGMPVEPVLSYPLGRRCVYLPNDYKACSPQSSLEFLRWVKSCFGSVEAVLCSDDPLPGIKHISKIVGGNLRNRVHAA